MLKKLLYILIGLGLSYAGIVYAANVSVPQATQKGDLVTGLTTGNYQLLHPGADGKVLTASSTAPNGVVWATASSTGGSGITTLNGLVNTTQTFASGTPPTGIDLFINSSGSTHTFRLGLQGGYSIPLTASTTEWSNFYATPSARITAGTGLSWSGNTLNSLGGDVVGPASAVNNNVVFFDSTSGKLIKDSGLTLSGNNTGDQDLSSYVVGPNGGTAANNVVFFSDTTGKLVQDNGIQLTGSNSGDVTLSGQNYLSITGQAITVNQINLGSHVTGVLPIANGGTATSTAPAASAVLVGNGTNFDYTTLPSCSNTTTSKLLYNNSTRSFSCGTDQTGSGGGATTTITSNVQSDGPNFTFATGTATGIGLNISGSGATITFTPTVSTNYIIPLSASTTNWNNFYNTPSTRITAGSGLSWSGNTLSNAMASSTIIAGGTATHSPSITFATTTDTNILLSIVCGTSTCTFNPGWTGTLADGRIASAATWNAKQNALTFPLAVNLGGTGSTSLNTTLVSEGNNLYYTDARARGAISLTTTGTSGAATYNSGTGALNIPQYQAAGTYLTAYNVISANGLITVSTTTALATLTASTSPTFTYVGATNASTTNLSVATNTYLTNVASCSNGVITGAGGLVSCNAAAFLTATAANSLYPTFSYASSSYATLWNLKAGSNITISTSSGVSVAVSSTPSFSTISVAGTTTLAATTTINGLTYYWPSTVSGTKILQNDGSGNLSWVADQTGGGGSLSGGTTGFVGVWASSTAMTTGTLRDNGTVSGVNATSSSYTFNIQGTSNVNPFNVSSSTGASLFNIDRKGQVNITGEGAAQLSIGSSTPYATLTVQGSSTQPTLDLLRVASSSNAVLLQVASNGSTTISSLGAGPVYSTSGGSLYIGAAGSGITSLGGQTGSSQTFATSTSGGLNLFINSASNIHTFTLQPASGYTVPLTASTTEWSTAYSWGNHAGLYPTFAYASSSYTTLWNLKAGSNITISTSSGVSLAVSASPTFTGITTTNASTTNLSVATDTYLTNVANCTNGIITGAGGKIACNGSAFLTSALTSLNGLTGASQTFATNTTATGLTQTITSSGTAHTWNLSLTAGYSIPLTASTTEWGKLTTYDKSFNLASTTPDYLGSSFSTATYTVPSIYNPSKAVTLVKLYCKTNTGTVLLNFASNLLSCTSSGASSTPSTNIAAEGTTAVSVGTGASSPGWVTVTATFKNQ